MKTIKPKVCPFFNKCVEDPPKNVKCTKNYEECNHYGWLFYYSSLSLPAVCPYAKYCEKANTCNTMYMSPQGDYRECETFSERFWEQRAKGK